MNLYRRIIICFQETTSFVFQLRFQLSGLGYYIPAENIQICMSSHCWESQKESKNYTKKTWLVLPLTVVDDNTEKSL